MHWQAASSRTSSVVAATNTGESRQGANAAVAPELMTRVSTWGVLSVPTA